MRHNPQSDPRQDQSDEFALPSHRVLALSGRDAATFAQAQFMNDVAALDTGQWQWNGWLTAKGRLVALFALLKLDAQTLWLLLPDADPAELAAALQRFVFRSKVALEPRAEMRVTGSWSSPAQASLARISGDADTGIELDMGADGGPRCLRIRPGAMPTSSPDGADRWTAFDLEHGLPRLAPAQSGQWTPQQLSLERLNAFSVRKGCYPGQEIVARTHFLGQAKRGLGLFEAEAPIAAGSEVRDGEHTLGTVVSSAGRLALAVLPLERQPDVALQAGGLVLGERRLLDGLAR